MDLAVGYIRNVTLKKIENELSEGLANITLERVHENKIKLCMTIIRNELLGKSLMDFLERDLPEYVDEGLIERLRLRVTYLNIGKTKLDAIDIYIVHPVYIKPELSPFEKEIIHKERIPPHIYKLQFVANDVLIVE